MITDPFKKVDNSLSSSGMLFTGKEASERLLIRNSNDFFPSSFLVYIKDDGVRYMVVKIGLNTRKTN